MASFSEIAAHAAKLVELTVEELDALPDLSVVVDEGGRAHQKHGMGGWHGAWCPTAIPVSSRALLHLRGKVTLIHRGSE